MLYNVKLLDRDGCEIATSEQEGLARARICAMDYLEDTEYANDAHKVEVLTEDGVCVWDRFAK